MNAPACRSRERRWQATTIYELKGEVEWKVFLGLWVVISSNGRDRLRRDQPTEDIDQGEQAEHSQREAEKGDPILQVQKWHKRTGVILQTLSKRPRLVLSTSGSVASCVKPDSGVENRASLGFMSSNTDRLQARSVEAGVSDVCPMYGMTSVCGRRRNMEDALSIRQDFLRGGIQNHRKCHFFGVYDGHGCSHVATSCGDRMYEIVAEELERLESSPVSQPRWKQVMERSFSRMDTEVIGLCGSPPNKSCRCELQMPECEHVGSTAVVAIIAQQQIVIANCGDSRAVICRRGLTMPLSSDHKPDRPDELQRIQAAGGRVIYWNGARVLGVLSMSRAIGDNYLKPYVISQPEVTVIERTEEDECLILASDGLWDVMTNEMACDIVRMCLRGGRLAEGLWNGEAGVCASAESDGSRGTNKACSDAAVLLTKMALARHSADNISVVVVDLTRSS